MIHGLRHVSLCLWISLALGGFGSLWILPVLQPALGAEAAPLLAAGLLAAAFAAVAWTFNRLGLGRVQRLMRSADRAEREGLRTEAEKAFQGALAALDGFWVSPGARRRSLLPLVGRTARFYLSQIRFSAAAEDFITAYLWAHPHDEEVAEQWMRHAERQGGLRDEHQDLADRLGNAHPRNAAIQREVARLYLALERTDYPALQSYRRVYAEAGQLPAEFCTDLARLLRRDGRSDEWAQQVLRQAGTSAPAPAETLSERRPEPPHIADRDEHWVKADMPLAAEEGDATFRMSGEADELDEDEVEERASLRAEHQRGPSRLDWHWLVRRCADTLEAARGALQSLGSARVRWRHRLFRGWGLRQAPAVLLIVGIAAGGVWIAAKVSDVFTPTPTEPSVADPASAPAPPAADLFTLQVAAHLKQEYALKLVEDLRKKGLDAYWIETVSGGKTWYQVRIARFPDQQSAREYGRNLKWKGVIDDFYVTGYSR